MKPYCWKICSFPGISFDPFLHLLTSWTKYDWVQTKRKYKKTKRWYKKRKQRQRANSKILSCISPLKMVQNIEDTQHHCHKLRLTCPELCFSCIPSPKFISKPCLCGDPQKDIYMRFGTGIEYFQKSEEWLTNSCVTKISQSREKSIVAFCLKWIVISLQKKWSHLIPLCHW